MESRLRLGIVALFAAVVHWTAALVLDREADAAEPVTVYTDPKVTYKLMPTLPDVERSQDDAQLANLGAEWSMTEAHAAEAQSHAADEMAAANARALKAVDNQLKSTNAASDAMAAAEHARRMRAAADAVAKHTKELIEEIPIAAHDAAETAIRDVVQATLDKLQLQACEAAKASKAAETVMMKKAADSAQKAALPFKLAKVGASQNMVAYLTKAQALANAATKIKGKAIEIAWQAEQYNTLRTLPMAQQISIQARDMMDKALQLQGQAKGFQDTAGKLQGQLGLFDLQAGAAAAYAAFEANPGGGPFKVPPLPHPLKLPPGCLNPAPGPAPAAM